MPRNLEGSEPIMLRHLLKTFRIGRGTFHKKFVETTRVQTGLSTIRHLIDHGFMPRRTPNFKEAMEEFMATEYARELRAMRMTPQDIWKPMVITRGVNDDLYEDEDDRRLRLYTEVQMLRESTLKHFKLKANPFSNELLSAKQMFMGADHTYALEVMRSVAKVGGFAVVTGQSGSGKSTIRNQFFAESDSEVYRIVYVKSLNKRKINAKTLLHAIIYDLSEREPKGNEESLVRQAEKLLLSYVEDNIKIILVIEEAHDLTVDTLKILKRLYELDDGQCNRLISIILIGQNELEYRLYCDKNPELREVAPRTTHARLEPIDGEVVGYVAKRFENVGADINKIFSPDAIKMFSEGIKRKDRNGKGKSLAYPLYINTLVMKYLNEAAAIKEPQVTTTVIEMVGI